MLFSCNISKDAKLLWLFFFKKKKTICLFCQLPPHLFPFEVKILPGKTWLNIETQFIDSVSERTGHTQIRLGNTPIG